MRLKFDFLAMGMVIILMAGCSKEPNAEPSQAPAKQTSTEPSFEFLKKANSHAKLIALRGPNWSKADLSYVLSACWRFARGANISAGRATCALAYEELSLPTPGIDLSKESPLASCFTATEFALFRMELIDKDIEKGTSAMDAILAYDHKAPDEREVIDDDFAACQKAFPSLRPDIELISDPKYIENALKLMPSRRRREAQEALETAASLTWPNEA